MFRPKHDIRAHRTYSSGTPTPRDKRRDIASKRSKGRARFGASAFRLTRRAARRAAAAPCRPRPKTPVPRPYRRSRRRQAPPGAAGRLVDHHGDDQARVAHRRDADERRAILVGRVRASDLLARRARLAADAVALDRRGAHGFRGGGLRDLDGIAVRFTLHQCGRVEAAVARIRRIKLCDLQQQQSVVVGHGCLLDRLPAFVGAQASRGRAREGEFRRAPDAVFAILVPDRLRGQLQREFRQGDVARHLHRLRHRDHSVIQRVVDQRLVRA